LSVQEAANCVIGKDYPEPCVNHEEIFKENIAKLRQFFQAEKREMFEAFLNDKCVLKPANSIEYKQYTFLKFLESQLELVDA
jgi:hypothetical protein